MSFPRLHAVTDDRVLALPDFLERARALAIGPAVAIHLRSRRDGRAVLALAGQLRALTRSSGTRLIVNDRADVARLAEADGVHLPDAGLPTPAARRLLPGRYVGRSVHRAEAVHGASAADWVFLGPIWPTASHADRPTLGVVALAGTGAVAIGGVTPERAREAARHGATGVAAIGALWDAPDPGSAARAFLVSLG